MIQAGSIPTNSIPTAALSFPTNYSPLLQENLMFFKVSSMLMMMMMKRFILPHTHTQTHTPDDKGTYYLYNTQIKGYANFLGKQVFQKSNTDLLNPTTSVLFAVTSKVKVNQYAHPSRNSHQGTPKMANLEKIFI